MVRRPPLAVIAVLFILLVLASLGYFAAVGPFTSAAGSADRARDSLPNDSVARVQATREIDTSCIASRIGLPCAQH